MRDYSELFFKIGKLKRIEREGWKRFGIYNPESVAEHSFRAALIGLILGEKFELDAFQLVKLLLIHDLAEIETGDLTPDDYDTKKEKLSKEKKAIEDILNGSKDENNNLVELWKEFEIGESQEAKIARDIDKLEMIIQALEYKEEYPKKDISEFVVEGKKDIESPEIKKILNEIIEY